MTNLTTEQRRQLNSYSVYTEPSTQPLFTFADVLDSTKTAHCVEIIQAISQSPNESVAISYFMRRFGMFIAMQLTQLAAYDEWWRGDDTHLQFGAIKEYGKVNVSTFTRDDDWDTIDDSNRQEAIRTLLEESHVLIQQFRTVTAISPITLWENIFGFVLWQYYVLLENPATAEEARADFEALKQDALWEGIAHQSRFATYLKGSEPKTLVNTTVRSTCCFSKDVPGLMQCGFCPLKNQ